MRAINHALTGAFIGLTVSEPLIAMPLAFFSHYALDAIPHFGQNIPKSDQHRALTNKIFVSMIYIDAILCFILVLVIFLNRPINWLNAVLCAFLAAAPDFLSINRFYKEMKNKPWKGNLHSRFASKIQWFEKPSGAVVETVWLIGAVILISIFLKH